MPHHQKPLKEVSVIEKRNLLASSTLPKEALIGYGDDFLKQELLYDAMEFYKAASHLEGLEQVKRKAMELGNVGALSWLAGYRMITVDEGNWRAAAESAERSGKLTYAELAFRRAGDEEEANRLRKGASAPSPPSEEEQE